MTSELAVSGSAGRDAQASQQTVYVLMSENADGVAGMVCATRERAEDELRDVLSEYITYDERAPHPIFAADAIEAFVEQARCTCINPHEDDRVWIDVCPVHT